MNDCLFCKIVAGDVPASTVHEGDGYLAFDDINPKADRHVLVIPTEHHGNLDDYIAAGGDAARMLTFVKETARVCGIAGRYRLITNVGPAAGQEVMHLHWHLLAGDDLPGFH